MRFLGIYREQMFSPGRVDDDAAIMDATLLELRNEGHEIDAIGAEILDGRSPDVDCVLTMGQSSLVLRTLEESKDRGVRIVNPVTSIRSCNRAPLMRLLASAGLPLPPGHIVPVDAAERWDAIAADKHYWVKRGDAHAVEPGDVVKVGSQREFEGALGHFRAGHIAEIVIQEHVEGEVIKFYGVCAGPMNGSSYFSAFPARSDVEITHGVAELRSVAARAARAVGLEVYGGDAVITPSGTVVLIDLNAWPSFSRCRSRAAESIAGYVAGVERVLRVRTSRAG